MTATNASVVQGNAKPSGPRWKFGAADAVVAGSTVLVFAIVGVFVLLCFQGYSQTIEEAKEKAQRAASVVADGSRWVVNSARSVLENASARYSVNQSAEDAIDAFRLSASPLPATILSQMPRDGALEHKTQAKSATRLSQSQSRSSSAASLSAP
jgi:hypothetical protein